MHDMFFLGLYFGPRHILPLRLDRIWAVQIFPGTLTEQAREVKGWAFGN